MKLTKHRLLALIVLVGLIIISSIMLANHHAALANSEECKHTGQLYTVVIENNRVSPENTDAHLCDKLLFVNRDTTVRAISFGPHEKHVPYDGVSVKNLNHNQSFTITLNMAGLYQYHDHIHDEVSGFFSVSK